MYTSPIIVELVEGVTERIMNERENRVMTVLKERYNVIVDKDELIKALNYDREQYEKGYEDGFKAAKEEALKNLKENIQMLCG